MLESMKIEIVNNVKCFLNWNYYYYIIFALALDAERKKKKKVNTRLHFVLERNFESISRIIILYT